MVDKAGSRVPVKNACTDAYRVPDASASRFMLHPVSRKARLMMSAIVSITYTISQPGYSVKPSRSVLRRTLPIRRLDLRLDGHTCFVLFRGRVVNLIVRTGRQTTVTRVTTVTIRVFDSAGAVFG